MADARVLGRAGILGWRPGYRGVYLRIEPVFEFEREMSMSDAQRYVLDFVSSHPQMYEGGAALGEVTSAVMAAKSPQDLFTAAA